jgi:RNA polymerase sigma-70 factor (ECF subfamily)
MDRNQELKAFLQMNAAFPLSDASIRKKDRKPPNRLMSQEYRKLVEGCIRQDARPQRELYRLFAPKMMAVCYRYARGRAEAEDMLQEGFVKVFRNLPKYQFTGSLEGWIRRLMINTAIDQLRKYKHQRSEVDIEAAETEETSGEMLDTLELEYLYGLIQDLPPGYRLVFNLFAIEGYSHGEIAEKLNISESTSRSQYTRARALLRKRIYEDRMEPNIYQDAI